MPTMHRPTEMNSNILNLPVEITDKFMEQLLPPLSICTVMESSLWQDLESRPTRPTDLCRLRLVCKAFDRLAFPWVWKRATIRLGKTYGTYRPPNQFLPLCNRVEAAAHIRILHINISQCLPDDLAVSLTALRPAILLMDNIRVLKFTCLVPQDDGLREIYALLNSKRHLHTLLTWPYIPPNPDLHSLHSLKHLHAASPDFPQSLQPGLESLVLRWCRGDILTLSLPWETLREIGIEEVRTWSQLQDNFLLWKESSPDKASPLAELSIENSHETIDMLHGDLVRLIVGFQSQNITTLRFHGVASIEGALLDTIGNSFPGIENLGLMADHLRGRWNVDMPNIVAFFQRLPRLKSLCWNYVGELVFIDIGMRKTLNLQRFRTMVPVIGKGSRTPETMTFLHWASNISYVIQRDDMGEYCGYVEEEEGPEVEPCPTSSWSTSRYIRI